MYNDVELQIGQVTKNSVALTVVIGCNIFGHIPWHMSKSLPDM